jgi:hypothetical protein
MSWEKDPNLVLFADVFGKGNEEIQSLNILNPPLYANTDFLMEPSLCIGRGTTCIQIIGMLPQMEPFCL